MIDKNLIEDSVNRIIEGTDLFTVDIALKTGNIIEIVLDSDTQVSIDDCVRVNRELCNILNATNEDDFDFELTVFSAGLTEPLKLKRQYLKNKGKEVEAILKSGRKIRGILKEISDDSIEIEYTVKEKLPDAKRKTDVVHVEKLMLDSLKSTKQVIKI
jgi:ribosome maturation factor RimP